MQAVSASALISPAGQNRTQDITTTHSTTHKRRPTAPRNTAWRSKRGKRVIGKAPNDASSWLSPWNCNAANHGGFIFWKPSTGFHFSSPAKPFHWDFSCGINKHNTHCIREDWTALDWISAVLYLSNPDGICKDIQMFSGAEYANSRFSANPSKAGCFSSCLGNVIISVPLQQPSLHVFHSLCSHESGSAKLEAEIWPPGCRCEEYQRSDVVTEICPRSWQCLVMQCKHGTHTHARTHTGPFLLSREAPVRSPRLDFSDLSPHQLCDLGLSHISLSGQCSYVTGKSLVGQTSHLNHFSFGIIILL